MVFATVTTFIDLFFLARFASSCYSVDLCCCDTIYFWLVDM